MFIRFDADDPPLPERGYMRLRKRTLSTDTAASAASAASASAAAAMCASQLSLTEEGAALEGLMGKQAVVMSNQQEEEENEKRKVHREEAPKVAGESVNHGAVEYDDGFVIKKK